MQVGNGTASGALYPTAPINDNGTFVYNSTTPLILADFGANITGTGNVIVRYGAKLEAIQANTYTGWTEIDAGGVFQPSYGNRGQLFSSVVTNNGELFISRQDGNPLPVVFGYSNNIVGRGFLLKENNNQNDGWIALAGTNTYTGGTYIAGGGIVLGDGVDVGAGSIVGPVIFTNSSLGFDNPRHFIFDRPDNFTFTNLITSVANKGTAANFGEVEQSGAGIVALTGNNNYPAGTTIDAGLTLQVGAGGTSGSIGDGPVTDGGVLVFNLSSTVALTNSISEGLTSPPGRIALGPWCKTVPAH